MKSISVLENVYARIDVLELDKTGRSFVRSASLFMLADACKYVKSIDDINVKNKKLVNMIGVKAVKELNEPISIVGGDDDWDELDDLDFEELVNTDAPIVSEKKEVSSSTLLDKDQFYEYAFYTKDKPSDIKEKIGIATGIPPYKQYLWMPNAHCSIDGDEVSLMGHWASSIRIIEGFPIDGHRPLMPSEIPLESFTQNSTIVMSCINLDSIISSKSKLSFLARSDLESFELIHSNAIQRFWQQITLPIFIQYLADASMIETSFNQLEFDRKEFIRLYKYRSELIPELNSQSRVTATSDLLTISTISIVLAYIYADQTKRVDTMKLFQSIDITKLSNITTIDLYYVNDDRRSVRLRKIPQINRFQIHETNAIIYPGVHPKKKLLLSGSIVITFLPQPEYDSMILIVDQYGSSWIKAQPAQAFTYSKEEFLRTITPEIDRIFDMINSFDLAYTSQDRYSKLEGPVGKYQILSSSSKLSIKFPISYSKLIDLMISKLMRAGFVQTTATEKFRRSNVITNFAIRYGVSRADQLGQIPSIDINDIQGVAIIVLSNLDVEESSLYVDIIGRLITLSADVLKVKLSGQSQLGAIDPVLFRPNSTSDGYSRICQRRFQPVVATADDKKAVKYYNFTFQRPEFYKCPSKEISILGFIQGKHEQGFCLPCCRKTQQANAKDVHSACTNNEAIDPVINSTYKIDYPIASIANKKIMNRRISIPDYIGQLFGIQQIVANGSIMYARDLPDDQPAIDLVYMRSATIIAAVEGAEKKPKYKSSRELILEIIAMIKHPASHTKVMRHPLVSHRYTTPQSLIVAIEERFLKNTIMQKNKKVSAMEWNDLIIFLSNCIGLNILVLVDDRTPNTGIQITNLNYVDVTKPVLLILKRINTEWYLANHGARALYLPITQNALRVFTKMPLLIPRLDISKALKKIKRITDNTKSMLKQFTLTRLTDMIEQNKQYQLIGDNVSQKLAVVRTGRNQLITTVSTMAITLEPVNIDEEPTASLKDLLAFIIDYNTYAFDETSDIKTSAASYKLYLQVALKSVSNYEFFSLSGSLAKIRKFVIFKDMVIGALVNIVEVNRVTTTELMFFKPTPVKTIDSELKKQQSELSALQSRMNIKAIVCFPISTNIWDSSAFITWLNHPLQAANVLSGSCKLDMKQQYNRGTYMNGIYPLLISDIATAWGHERQTNLDDLLIKKIKQLGSLPVAQSKIDKLIEDVSSHFAKYDPSIVRVTINNLFSHINTIDKTPAQAVDRLKRDSAFVGFELKNVYRLTRKEVCEKVTGFMKDITVKTSTYPSFDLELSLSYQRDRFYQESSGKLLIHSGLYSDLIDMVVSDLTNPFRRDYVLNLPIVQASVNDVSAHDNELVYVQFLGR